MIRVDRITNDYGGSHPAIVNLQFCIQPGSVTVMVGTTGSGKSTLLRVLAGLEVPMSGVIRWDSGAIRLSVSCFRSRGACRGSMFART